MYKELSARRIWAEVRQNRRIVKYFPDMRGRRVPQRAYLLNVINTVIPNKVIDLIKNLQKEKEEPVEYEPVDILAEYADLMPGFVSISTDRSEHGLGGIAQRLREVCCICQQVVTLQQMRPFSCKRHRGHGRCVAEYYRRRNPSDKDRYLCPYKCKPA